jgi:DNA-directed RNA polymerase specialized sigma subunit
MLDRALFDFARSFDLGGFDEFDEEDIKLIEGMDEDEESSFNWGFSVEPALYLDPDFEPTADSAEECAAAQQENGILHKAVMMLPPRQAQVIILRFGFSPLGDHTQQETADLLRIAQPVVAKYEKAAIANLAKVLKSFPEGLELIASRLIAMGKAV